MTTQSPYTRHEIEAILARRHVDVHLAIIRHLIALLHQANEAFDECTGDYPKELVASEPWREYRDHEAQLN